MSTYYVAGIPFSSNDALAHHGILGMKWGVRRYQNPDGTYTAAGKERYFHSDNESNDALMERMTKNSTHSSRDLNTAVRKYATDKSVQKKIVNAASNSKDLMDSVESFKDSQDKLNDAFSPYFDKLVKEQGDWTGDGTEAHWEMEKRYPEYKALSEQYESSKQKCIDSIKQFVEKGSVNNVFKDTKNLLYRDDIKQYKWSRVLDGRNAVVGEVLSQQYGIELFMEDFGEARSLNKGKLGKKINDYRGI